jgi:hypothetical protein
VLPKTEKVFLSNFFKQFIRESKHLVDIGNVLCMYVYPAQKSSPSTATCSYHPKKQFFSLLKLKFLRMFSALCRIFVIGQISGSIFLPNIRFRPKQENPLLVKHY